MISSPAGGVAPPPVTEGAGRIPVYFSRFRLEPVDLFLGSPVVFQICLCPLHVLVLDRVLFAVRSWSFAFIVFSTWPPSPHNGVMP